jgi:hypothetical protein
MNTFDRVGVAVEVLSVGCASTSSDLRGDPFAVVQFKIGQHAELVGWSSFDRLAFIVTPFAAPRVSSVNRAAAQFGTRPVRSTGGSSPRRRRQHFLH